MEIPTIPTISHPTTRSNFTVVEIGYRTYWFSYQTCVACQDWKHPRGPQLVVRRNEWGPTTGKHLDYIDGGAKSTRVDGLTFAAYLSESDRSM
jgi:hypothetical protein